MNLSREHVNGTTSEKLQPIACSARAAPHSRTIQSWSQHFTHQHVLPTSASSEMLAIYRRPNPSVDRSFARLAHYYRKTFLSDRKRSFRRMSLLAKRGDYSPVRRLRFPATIEKQSVAIAREKLRNPGMVIGYAPCRYTHAARDGEARGNDEAIIGGLLNKRLSISRAA